MEYSKEINSLLGNQKLPPTSGIEDPRMILRVMMWFFLFFPVVYFGYSFCSLLIFGHVICLYMKSSLTTVSV